MDRSLSRQNKENLRIFLNIRQNVSLSGLNGNFDYKFNDHKNVPAKSGLTILPASPKPTSLFIKKNSRSVNKFFVYHIISIICLEVVFQFYTDTLFSYFLNVARKVFQKWWKGNFIVVKILFSNFLGDFSQKRYSELINFILGDFD